MSQVTNIHLTFLDYSCPSSTHTLFIIFLSACQRCTDLHVSKLEETVQDTPSALDIYETPVAAQSQQTGKQKRKSQQVAPKAKEGSKLSKPDKLTPSNNSDVEVETEPASSAQN